MQSVVDAMLLSHHWPLVWTQPICGSVWLFLSDWEAQIPVLSSGWKTRQTKTSSTPEGIELGVITASQSHETVFTVSEHSSCRLQFHFH